MPRNPDIFVDADACPVKDEVYRVAVRYNLRVHVVANAFIRVPKDPLIVLKVVDAGPDIADDWIIEHMVAGDVIITADIPLADRALKAGAFAVAPTGKPFTSDSIAAALATRTIMEHLRSTGETTGGPRPFAAADRSRFLQALDEAVNRARRGS
ncbi:MAG: YaiI/YqxD family protein [Alphaproteobacteria bacterium]